MIRVSLIAILAAGITMTFSQDSSADSAQCPTTHDVTASSGQSALQVGVGASGSCGGRSAEPALNEGSDVTYHQEELCTGPGGACVACPNGGTKLHVWATNGDGTKIYDWLGCPTAASVEPQLTTTMVASALRRVPLPPSTFAIEPPGGKTLVNFDTNFYTRERTLHRVVRLLGREVQLRIEIDSYTWHFGDGESVTTRQPGAPYPKLLITHSYREKGDYRPAMDTTWVADYRVGSGPWRPVPGSVTIEGGPVDLRAIEARPTLVGYGD